MVLDSSQATVLLQRINEGDAQAAAELMPLVYDELRRIAGEWMQRERRDHTLQPTALVNEAWVRVMGSGEALPFDGRSHFLRLSARAMRNVLVDHARRRGAEKRGSGKQPVVLDEAFAPSRSQDPVDIVALDDLLNRLATLNARHARVVELRFFGGLSVQETAHALEVSPATVKNDWRAARAWLLSQLSDDDSGRI